MIQRIQSIFLILSASILGSNFSLPFATSDDTTQKYYGDGMFNVYDLPILTGLIIAACVLTLLIIFMYKKRQWQLRLCILSLIIIGAIMGFLGFVFSNTQTFTFALGSITPILALIFSILAYFYIKKDDKLVKSMDRLR